MKNINNYANLAAYTADTNRPTGESAVSLINDGTGVKFDGKNVIVHPMSCGVGDAVIFDTTTQKTRALKLDTFNAATKPASITPTGIVLQRTESVAFIGSLRNSASAKYAAPFKAKLAGFDLATGGSFTITVNSTTTGAIVYTSTDTLATIATSIAAALTTAGFTSALGWSVTANTTYNCILIARDFYSTTINSLTATDAASKVVSTIIAVDKQTVLSGLIAVYGSIYRNDGYATYFAPSNPYKSYDYFYTNGGTETNQAVGAASIVKYAVFNATDNPLLVAAYGSGTTGYAAYIQAKSVRRPYSKGAITAYSGKSDTAKLAASTYVDFDGTTKPYYPAAYNAFNYGITIPGYTTGFEANNWWLPSVNECDILTKDRKLDNSDPVNRTLAAMGMDLIPASGFYPWCSTECSSDSAWVHYGYYGIMSGGSKGYSYHVRTVTALNLKLL